jgi:hypothetical protein
MNILTYCAPFSTRHIHQKSRDYMSRLSKSLSNRSIDREQLQAAYKKTDSNPKPPDFVSGEAASELASKILALLESIGCSSP